LTVAKVPAAEHPAVTLVGGGGGGNGVGVGVGVGVLVGTTASLAAPESLSAMFA